MGGGEDPLEHPTESEIVVVLELGPERWVAVPHEVAARQKKYAELGHLPLYRRLVQIINLSA